MNKGLQSLARYLGSCLSLAEVHRYYADKARAQGIKDPLPGSISFTQRGGSALNLNIHTHLLCPDGVFVKVGEKIVFRNIEAITDEEVAALIKSIAKRVMHHLRRKGYLDKDGEVILNPLGDELFAEHESISLAAASSISGKIAFGPNAGRYVTRIGAGFGFLEEIPLAKGRRCYSVNGFSVHANTSINALQ